MSKYENLEKFLQVDWYRNISIQRTGDGNWWSASAFEEDIFCTSETGGTIEEALSKLNKSEFLGECYGEFP